MYGGISAFCQSSICWFSRSQREGLGQVVVVVSVVVDRRYEGGFRGHRFLVLYGFCGIFGDVW